jgi:predicted nucleic acid-binding protein
LNLVLDSSATLAWIFPEERTDAILNLFTQVASNGAVVPELWRLEVANTLNVGIRRGRITMENRDGILADLENLPIFIDGETRTHTWSQTLELTDKYGLTIYDATYLELALRLSLPLATLDNELRNAAQSEGVALLGK